MRIGVLGGTFDPPHIGHLALAQAAIERLELDEVMLLPANRNPLKERRNVSSPADRLEMVKRLIADQPKMAVSDMEITRGGASYTVDTLDELHMIQSADYWLLMGSDALKTLPEWRSAQRLLRLCRLGVAIRPGTSEMDVTSRLPEEVKKKIDLIEMPPMNVSSTDVRDRVSRGLGTAGWVPTPVMRHIQERQLYRD